MSYNPHTSSNLQFCILCMSYKVISGIIFEELPQIQILIWNMTWLYFVVNCSRLTVSQLPNWMSTNDMTSFSQHRLSLSTVAPPRKPQFIVGIFVFLVPHYGHLITLWREETWHLCAESGKARSKPFKSTMMGLGKWRGGKRHKIIQALGEKNPCRRHHPPKKTRLWCNPGWLTLTHVTGEMKYHDGILTEAPPVGIHHPQCPFPTDKIYGHVGVNSYHKTKKWFGLFIQYKIFLT